MPRDQIQISADKAHCFAHDLGVKIRLAISQLCDLDEGFEKLLQFARGLDNGNAMPRGYDLEDIPGTPFQVVFDPLEEDAYHAIIHMGVDISNHVSSTIEEDAIEVVRESYLDKHDQGRLSEAASLRKLDERRGK